MVFASVTAQNQANPDIYKQARKKLDEDVYEPLDSQKNLA
jgi:hypothetical protein